MTNKLYSETLETVHNLYGLLKFCKDEFKDLESVECYDPYSEEYDENYHDELEILNEKIIENLAFNNLMDELELDMTIEEFFDKFEQGDDEMDQFEQYYIDAQFHLLDSEYQSYVISKHDANILNKFEQVVLYDNRNDNYIVNFYWLGMPTVAINVKYDPTVQDI